MRPAILLRARAFRHEVERDSGKALCIVTKNVTAAHFEVCMKMFVVAMILFSGLSFGHQYGETNETSRQAPVAGEKEQEKSFVNALRVVFKDPATGKIKTSKYDAYLEWQAARSELVRQIIDAETDLLKQRFARRLASLDQDFRLFNPEILRAMDILSAAETKLYDDSAFNKIKNHDEKTYEKWQKDRQAIVELIKKDPNDQKTLSLVGKLNLIDRSFKIQFIGFLLGLPAE